MSLWVPHSAFWDWQVAFGLPSLKYSYALCSNVDVSKPVIIIDRCVVSYGLHLQIYSVSFKLTAKTKMVLFHVVFCTWMTSSSIYIYALKQHSMSTCKQNKHMQRHLVQPENAISNCENYEYTFVLFHCP